MIAPREQLVRWQKMLDTPRDTVVVDGVALAATLRADHGRHRHWLTACLAAVEAARAGVDVPYDTPLPPSPGERRSAAVGADVADDVWTAYLLYALGRKTAADWLTAMIARLDPTALVFTAHDNPEPWWQNEMVILHALHSFALRNSDHGDLLTHTLACADFHLREIQPDHATNEPWSIHAYASHPDGNVTAETLLHAGHIQHGGTLGPVARRLARDAASSLEAYLRA